MQALSFILVVVGAVVLDGGLKENKGRGSMPVMLIGLAILAIGVGIFGVTM